MAEVAISDLRKSFGALEILHGVSIDIAEGEFVVLVGPSGCGKSTLLRMLAGLEHVTSGEIRIGDRVVNDLPPKDRDIAMVFQNYALYPHMTVAENMAFSLTLRAAPKDEIAAKVAPAAEILGLSKLLDRYPRQLSGGQRQRVAMGRAIVRDPAVFLFDEPLSNLDAKLRVEMRTEIKRLHERLGTSIVYVTHDQIEAMTLATKVAVMRGGYIQQLADPRTIYEKPANLFVAGFIGSPSMNFLPGRLTRDGAGWRFRGDGIDLSLGGAAGPAEDRAAILGVRPEEMKVAAAGQGALLGEIDVVEPTGPDTMVTATIGATSVIARAASRFGGHRGEAIAFTVDPASVSLFDPDSEARIELA